MGTQCWRIAGWRKKVSVAEVEWWPVSRWVAVDRCRACCWWRAAGVQRAAWAGVVLLISRSIMERLIIGVGGVAVVGGLGGKVGGKVSELVGLSGWVGVVGSCVVVVDGVVSVVIVGGGIGSDNGCHHHFIDDGDASKVVTETG